MLFDNKFKVVKIISKDLFPLLVYAFTYMIDLKFLMVFKPPQKCFNHCIILMQMLFMSDKLIRFLL